MSAITMSQMIADQRMSLPLLVTKKTCTGATYIVTGANKGLGFETAKHLVEMGAAKVIIAVRNVQAGKAAMAIIEAATHTNGIVEVWVLDLGSYDSVKAFAKKAVTNLDRIDALVENAGLGQIKWGLTEGHETCITINVISTLLLAVLLLPKLSESAKRFNITPHIVVVTSEVAFVVAEPEWKKVKADPLVKLQDEKLADMSQRYTVSKLVQIFAVRELAALADINRTGVAINLVNPGMCKTELSVNTPFAMRMFIKASNMLLGRTPEAGSRTILHGVIAGKESHGCYLGSCENREKSVPVWVTNEDGKASQRRVWSGVAKELDLIEPGCMSRIL